MKIKRLLAILMVVAISMCLFVMPSSAEAVVEETNIEIYFEDENVSDELKAKAIAHFTSHNHEEDGATAYGLTCTLFGHNLESTPTTVVTHKARTTAPRCLQKSYTYEACTRCDYEKSTLVGSSYIYCCS